MMPATQLKMLRYMRSAEPKGATNDTTGGSPPLPSSPSGLQHAPLSLSARQQLAEAVKIPVPSSLRGATPGHQKNGALPAALPSPKQPQQQAAHDPPRRQPALQRTRSNSHSRGPHPPWDGDSTLHEQEQQAQQMQQQQQQQQQQQIWEESSVNSMFAESITTSTRAPPQRAAHTGRYGSPFPQQRTHQHAGRATGAERGSAERGSEEPAAALLAGDRGVLRILPTNTNGGAAAHADDPYAQRSPYGSPSRHTPVLKHSKYALRGARDATRRSSFTERQAHESLDGANGGSPDRRTHQRSESIPKRNEAAAFRNVDASTERTPRRPETDNGSDLPSPGDEAANQHTPRAERLASPALPPQQPPPAAPQMRVLHESSLPRVGGRGSGRRDTKPSRKRRHSPDYDDSMLHAMRYSELRDEPFDHDPARAAVHAPAVPATLSTEERLVHFQSKDAHSQHQFFAEMAVQEWDACGDWFLGQFAALANKIREKRQAKRRKMAAFEAELAERETMVRLQADSIERTLGDLRHEGEGMMRGKAVEF